MALMTGELTDAGGAPIAGLRPRMLWILNKTTLHGDAVVLNHPVEADISGSSFTADVVPTQDGEFYRIRTEYHDPNGNLVYWRELDQNIEVPYAGGTIGGGEGTAITSDLVYVGLEPPTDDRWQFWLEAEIGDPDESGPGILHRRVL